MAKIAKQTPFTKRIDSRVRTFIRKREVLRANERVLVAISGGPDSTALLLVLTRLREKLGLKLTAAHFDHKLRTREEAQADAAFCLTLCRSLRVPLTLGAGDVKRRVRAKGETVEEAARNLRYAFLGKEARTSKATAIAVGHTQDDRAETVLFNIIRGAGLDGLAAMPARSPWPFGKGPDIARPLLELSRADTERHCRDSGIDPRRDPTNDLPIATRNRLRNEVLPLLREFNPRVGEALARLSDAAGRDAEVLESDAQNWLNVYASEDRGGIVLDRANLQRLRPATSSRIIRRAALGLADGALEIEWQHVERVAATLSKRHSRVQLPGGLVAVTDTHAITIWAGEPLPPAPVPHVVLNLNGPTAAGDWRFDCRLAAWNGDSHFPDGRSEIVFELGNWPPFKVRSRQPGDRLRPLGMRGQKKVQDILVDAKVPRAERDAVPIVTDDEGIVWVVGHCIADRVKVTPKTRHVIHLRATRTNH